MIGIEPAKEPLDRDTFNKHLDHFLNTGKLNPDILPHLDSYQMYAINELKKAIKRLSKRQ